MGSWVFVLRPAGIGGRDRARGGARAGEGEQVPIGNTAWMGEHRTYTACHDQRQRILSVTGAALERQLVALHRVGLPGGASGHVRPPSTPSERGVGRCGCRRALGVSTHSEEDRQARVV